MSTGNDGLSEVAIAQSLRGRYEIVQEIGRGGMGVVFEAVDVELGRRVALKLVRARDGGVGADVRMLREARALAALSHPNVVPVFDAGMLDESEGASPGVFIAMELIDGETLSAWIKTSPPWPEVLEVFVDAGQGLAAAHRVGLVHRDFKPANVMLTVGDGEPRRVRVMDFGLATAYVGGDSSEAEPVSVSSPSNSGLEERLTQSGVVLGTPSYMAPEQHRRGELDGRADQFAFCVALYEALYGVRPFRQRSSSELQHAKASGDVAPPPDDRRVPAAIFAILVRGLAPEPEARWPSMDDLIAALVRRRSRSAGTMAALGGTAVLVALGLGITAWSGAGVDAQSCDAVDEELSDAWSEARREQLVAAFTAAPVRYGATTAGLVGDALDAYAGDWVVLRRETCEAAVGRTADPLVDRRLACVESARAQLRGVVEGLLEANASTVEHAVATVGGLPPLSECEDDDALAGRLAPPGDAAAAAEVERIREELSRSNASKGRDAEELAAIEVLLARAGRTDYAPVVAEVMLEHARALKRAGEIPEATQRFEDAYAQAVSARHDAVAAMAAAQASFELAFDGAQYDDALRWSQIALSVCGRLGEDPIEAQAAHGARAVVASLSGDYDTAEKHYLEAIRIGKLRHADPVAQAQDLVNLGDNYRRQGKFTKAREVTEAAVAILEASVGNDHPRLGDALTNLGIAIRMQGKVDEAEPVLERAVEVMRAAHGSPSMRLAMAIGNYANVFWDRKDWARVLELYAELVPMFEASVGTRHPATAMAYDNLAGVLAKVDRLDEALTLRQKALDLRQNLYGDTHAEVATSLCGMGTLLGQLGRRGEALAHLRRGIETMIASVGPEHPLIVPCRGSEGWALLEAGRVAEARATLQQAAAVCAREETEATGCEDIEKALAEAARG